MRVERYRSSRRKEIWKKTLNVDSTLKSWRFGSGRWSWWLLFMSSRGNFRRMRGSVLPVKCGGLYSPFLLTSRREAPVRHARILHASWNRLPAHSTNLSVRPSSLATKNSLVFPNLKNSPWNPRNFPECSAASVTSSALNCPTLNSQP